MSRLAKQYRDLAAEHNSAARSLYDSDTFITDTRKQTNAVVGFVSSKLYHALADMVEYFEGKEQLDPKIAQRKAILERNEAIRKAAARGDWDEFDKLSAGSSNEQGGDKESTSNGSSQKQPSESESGG